GPFGLDDVGLPDPVTMPPGATLRTRVVLIPSGIGSLSGELRLVGPEDAVLARIRVSAHVPAEPFAIQPSAIDFGLVAPGTELRSQVNLRNFTRDPLAVPNPAATGAPFRIEPAADFIVPADDPSTVEDEGFLEVE